MWGWLGVDRGHRGPSWFNPSVWFPPRPPPVRPVRAVDGLRARSPLRRPAMAVPPARDAVERPKNEEEGSQCPPSDHHTTRAGRNLPRKRRGGGGFLLPLTSPPRLNCALPTQHMEPADGPLRLRGPLPRRTRGPLCGPRPRGVRRPQDSRHNANGRTRLLAARCDDFGTTLHLSEPVHATPTHKGFATESTTCE